MRLDVERDERNRQEYEAQESSREMSEMRRAALENERILEVLVVAGHITKEQIESARQLVIWWGKAQRCN